MNELDSIPTDKLLDKLADHIKQGKVDSERVMKYITPKGRRGRPRKPTAGRPLQSMCIRMTDHQRNQLQRLARSRRKSMTSVLLSVLGTTSGDEK